MPIVKYIEREENLPPAVTKEIDRYIGNRFVSVEEYESYRNAAMTLYKRGKVKFSKAKLWKLAESIRDEAIFSQFNWAISNTARAYSWNAYCEAKDAAGKRFNEEKWVAEFEKANGDTFEASLFSWHKIDIHDEHPAILLCDLVSRYDPRNQK